MHTVVTILRRHFTQQWRIKMPLIAAPDLAKKQDVKLKLSASLVTEIKNYCSWAGIENNLDHFFSEAASMVLKKDKDWLATKRSSK